MKRKLPAAAAAALVCLLFVNGCAGGSARTETDTAAAGQDFRQFTRDIFIDDVTSDGLTQHYELADPSAYGISDADPTLGDLSADYDNSDDEENEETLRQLQTFDYDSLPASDQVTYDLLEEVLQLNQDAAGPGLYYYSEPLTSMSGTHAMLPILMAEYEFYDQKDVDSYLKLLADVPRYLDQVLAFEQAKSKAGLFMSDTTADTVISSCQSFIEDPGKNSLAEVFPEKVRTVEGLSQQNIDDYIKQNDDIIQNKVIPAYQKLADGIEELKGTGKNDGGLAGCKRGKEYYGLLARQQTGTDLTPEQMITMLESGINDTLQEMFTLIGSDSSLYDKLNGPFDLGTEDPGQMLSLLQEKILDEFPAAYTDKYTLKYVPEALEDSTNPAFYMTPPVDRPQQNVIYLNRAQTSGDMLYLFTTLAHEGYPGHLYQCSYYASTEPDPVREVMSWPGYQEGWATYVENKAYGWAGLDEKVSQCLAYNSKATLLLYGRIDLGVNYEGWDQAAVKKYLDQFGLGSDEAAKELFDVVVGNPGSYLPYCIGMLEFDGLRESAQETAGDSFDPAAFHQYIMDFGPSSFTVLEEHMVRDGIIKEETEEKPAA